MGVRRWDSEKKRWTGLRAGARAGSKKNEDRLSWHKPIYAMADGTVIRCGNSYPDNPEARSLTDAEVQALRDAGKWHGGGNHFLIHHGDELVLYAYMQEGSVNDRLCRPGTPVRKGDRLGRVGNSGSSSGPHLHIHALGTRGHTSQQLIATDDLKDLNLPYRPLPFHGIQALKLADLDPDVFADNPWAKVNGRGLYWERIAVWPGLTTPGIPPD